MSFWTRHFELYKLIVKTGIRSPRSLFKSDNAPNEEQSTRWIQEHPISEFNGFKMKLTTESNQEIWYNAHRLKGIDYEWATVELLKKTLKNTDTFLDIGSNSGYYSLYMAKKCKKVIAFEPSPGVFKRLNANIKLNKFRNITAYNVALSDHTGTTNFYIDKNNDGASSLSAGLSGEHVPVPVKEERLDKVLRGQKADVLKIDVEGYEYEVLRGGIQTLKNVRVIIFEQNLDIMDKRGILNNRTIDFLIEKGFTIHNILSDGSLDSRINDYRDATDLSVNLCATRGA